MAGVDGKKDLHPGLSEAISELRKIVENRPSVALADGKSGKSAETVRTILAAGLEVFTHEGHAGLSLRKVADEAGIAVGNLTYHFATKSELVEAVLTESLALFAEEHLISIDAGRDDLSDILENVVAECARNAHRSHRFFYQVWGYAGSGPTGRDIVRTLLQPIGRVIFNLMCAVNPDMDYLTVRRSVLHIFSLVEGYRLFIGLGPDDDIALAEARKDIRDLTQGIIMGRNSTTNSGEPVEHR